MNVSTRLQKTSRRKLLIQSGEADAWSYGIIFQKGTIFLVDGGFTLLLCMLVPITQFLALQTSGPHCCLRGLHSSPGSDV